MSKVKFIFRKHGEQCESEYDSIEEALDASVAARVNATCAPVAIEQDGVVVYDNPQLYEYYLKKTRPEALE